VRVRAQHLLHRFPSGSGDPGTQRVDPQSSALVPVAEIEALQVAIRERTRHQLDELQSMREQLGRWSTEKTQELRSEMTLDMADAKNGCCSLPMGFLACILRNGCHPV